MTQEPSNDEEEIIYWQDVLDAVMAGRSDGLVCPFCRKGALRIERGDRGAVRISCPESGCKKFIEGSMGPEYE